MFKNTRIKRIVSATVIAGIAATTATATSASASEPQQHPEPAHSQVIAPDDLGELLGQDFVHVAESGSVADMDELAREFSRVFSAIPDSALADEASWQQWRQEHLTSANSGEVSAQINKRDAFNCALGVVSVIAGSVGAVWKIKKIRDWARNSWHVYKFFRHVYYTYRGLVRDHPRMKPVRRMKASIRYASRKVNMAAVVVELILLAIGTTQSSVEACYRLVGAGKIFGRKSSGVNPPLANKVVSPRPGVTVF